MAVLDHYGVFDDEVRSTRAPSTPGQSTPGASGRSTPAGEGMPPTLAEMRAKVDKLIEANDAYEKSYYDILEANADNPDKHGVNQALDYEGVLIRDEKTNEHLMTCFYTHVQTSKAYGAVELCGYYFNAALWKESPESVSKKWWKCEVCMEQVRMCFSDAYKATKEKDPDIDTKALGGCGGTYKPCGDGPACAIELKPVMRCGRLFQRCCLSTTWISSSWRNPRSTRSQKKTPQSPRRAMY